MGKVAAESSLESFLVSFLGKTVQRSTDEEETKLTTKVSPIREKPFKISELFTTHSLLKGKFQNFQIKKAT